MSIKKFRLKKSFILTCAGHFLIYSLILFLLYTGINSFIQIRLNTAFPSIENLLAYEDALKEDSFSRLPSSLSGPCHYIIFGDDGQVIYTTSREISEQISADDISVINSYTCGTYYSIYETSDSLGNARYLIFLNSINEDTGSAEILESCVLDEEYRILYGNLFAPRHYLTEQEFDLLQGVYSKNMNIEKYEYETSGGENRTLVFLSPQINSASYDKIVRNTNWLWLTAIPVVCAIIIIEVFLFTRKIRKSIRPLNQAILSCQQNAAFELDEKNVPIEFLSTVDSFRELMKRLSRTQKEKEEIYQEKQRIVADISHDLKTPLTVIQGYAKAFMENRIPDSQKERYLTAIYNKSELASELIDSLFEYVRMDHPGYRLDEKNLELSEFIKAFLAEKYSEIENSGFLMDVDIPDVSIPFRADPKLLRRLLENLLGNALKYNPEGTTIYVSLRVKKQTIHLTVADDGVGIPEEIARQVFDPFITGSSARTSGEGTGLGLSIVKRIVSLHGGQIRLAMPPRVPYRTEFQITFPQNHLL